MKTRVVVTGLGVVSPIGIGVPSFWKAALEGRSGITAIQPFGDLPLDAYRCRVAGRVTGFESVRFPESVNPDRVDRYAQFALVATQEALADSGLRMDREPPHRVGVIVGAGMGGMVMGEREITQLYQSLKPNRVHPNFIPTITLNSASGIVAMACGAKGPNLTISTACRNRPEAWRECCKRAVETRDGGAVATDHLAVAALKTPHASAHTHVDVVHAERGEFFAAADVIDVVTVSAVDDAVVFAEVRDQRLDR